MTSHKPQTTVFIEKGSTGDKSYTAHWSEVAYTITYNLDGGRVTPANPTGYNVASETFELINPTKDGYTFTGWTGSNGDELQTIVAIEHGSTGNKSYTANYSVVSYSISYNLNGGTVVTANPTSYDVTSATIRLNNPTREGYTFTGWTATGLESPDAFAIIEKGSTGNREYTANWSINSYRLELIAGTGVATVVGAGMKEYNSSVTATCTMLAGYDFDSWTGDFTTETFNMPASYAIMTANARPINYSIAYTLNDGTVAMPNPTSYDVTSATIKLNNPTREGCIFTGWTGTGLATPDAFAFIEKGSTGNREYTANFMPISYSIAYTLNDGTVATPNPTSYDVTSSTITLNNPTKTGYTFKGWSGTGLTGDENKTVTITQGSTGTREYTANWTINSYQLDLIAGTGIASVTGSGTYEYNSSVTATCTIKAGYESVYWTGDFATDTFIMPASNVTMTANAKPIVYNITYANIDGATFTTPNPTTYDITSATITLNNPTKDNFYFAGWRSTGNVSVPTSSTISIVQGSTGNKRFTAVWLEIKTFNLPNGVELVMHEIPSGAFHMGSPDSELGHIRNEYQHTVGFRESFYMGIFEVTQDQYYAIMGTNPSYFNEGSSASESPVTSANYPVDSVSWNNIMTASTGFIDKINTQLAGQLPTGYKFDLPTEAQWEYACRALNTTSLNSGKNITTTSGTCSNLTEVGWYAAISSNKTHAVGEKLPNIWGLYDMHGNVSEWCKDWFDENYYTTFDGLCFDPQGPDSGSNRVCRGGNYGDTPKFCRSAYRCYSFSTASKSFKVGFRLVLVPSE